MNPISAQQVALDNALVVLEKRLKIEKCNMRIEFNKPQREPTFQVTLDVLKLSPCYLAFLITAEVPEIYMHQFWNTIKKIKDTDAYQFKLDKQKFQIDTKIKCTSPVEHLLLSSISASLGSPQVLIGSGRQELKSCEECSARIMLTLFTKVIINHFISKDKTISMRNMINPHTIQDDSLLGTLKYVSKTEDYQKYEALIPEQMINQAIKDSKEYKIYLAFAIREATPKKARKFKKITSPSKKQTLV
ncbi:hypothetical protein Tco_0647392 [Tanacetum coccineum]